MRIFSLITFLVIILASCSENKVKDESADILKSDTLVAKKDTNTDTTKADTSKSHPEGEYFLKLNEFVVYYKRAVEPVSFSGLSPVYSKPDTLSKIIKTLKFNTPLKPTHNSDTDEWIEVEYDHDTAYMRPVDVALYSFTSLSKDKKIKYFIQASTVYKYDFNQKKFIDTFHLKEFSPDYARQINSSKWKNVDLLLSISSWGNCCGCSDNTIYLMDANGKFEIIFTTTELNSDSEGEEYTTSVSLPFDPQEDSIVYHEYEQTGVYTKNDKPVLDKNGRIKTKVIRDVRKYYRWDGVKVVPIK